MSCTRSQIVLLLEYIERKISLKMKELKIEEKKRNQLILEVEKVKQNIIEYGLAEIEKEIGI